MVDNYVSRDTFSKHDEEAETEQEFSVAYDIGAIAQELGMNFAVHVDDGAVTYQFLIYATPPHATMERFFKVSEHTNVYEARAWLDGYVYALEGHSIGKPRIASDPRPKRPTRE